MNTNLFVTKIVVPVKEIKGLKQEKPKIEGPTSK